MPVPPDPPRLLRALYRAVGQVAAPALRLHLARRVARGKEDPDRLDERWGIAGRPRPPGPLVWIHAASVGESLSVLPLIERLRADRPGLTVLVTTATLTSARLMAERLPEGCRHQFVPLDVPRAVRRFLAHWRPSVAFWIESELWPTLLEETAHAGIPIALVNARMSPRSLRRWQWVPQVARWLLGHLDLCLAQTPEDGARLAALGGPPPLTPGNLKFAAAPLPHDVALLRQAERQLCDRPRWLAASTHPGEEAAAADVHRALAPRHPGLITLIVPRHPERGPEIAGELAASGWSVGLRSRGDPIDPTHSLYVADGLGELGTWYRLVEVVFIGGSLAPKGSQNPLEPARLGCAVLQGPSVFNFAQIAAEMAAAGASLPVRGADALAEDVDRLLADLDHRAGIIAAAARYAGAQRRVLDSIAGALEPLLTRALGPALATLDSHAAE